LPLTLLSLSHKGEREVEEKESFIFSPQRKLKRRRRNSGLLF
jgi:hypothetical protein